MLTQQELDWLERRKVPCDRCSRMSAGYPCAGQNKYCVRDGYKNFNMKMAKPDWEDAAIFMERVLITILQHKSQVPCDGTQINCPYTSLNISCGDCMLKHAMLYVEEYNDI